MENTTNPTATTTRSVGVWVRYYVNGSDHEGPEFSTLDDLFAWDESETVENDYGDSWSPLDDATVYFTIDGAPYADASGDDVDSLAALFVEATLA